MLSPTRTRKVLELPCFAACCDSHVQGFCLIGITNVGAERKKRLLRCIYIYTLRGISFGKTPEGLASFDSVPLSRERGRCR